MRHKKSLSERQLKMRTRSSTPTKLGGRPPKIFDQQLVYNLAGQMLSNEKIAELLDTTPQTLVAHCSEALGRGRARFTIPIKMKLIELALVDGEFRALDWLLRYVETPASEPDSQRTVRGLLANAKRIYSRKR